MINFQALGAIFQMIGLWIEVPYCRSCNCILLVNDSMTSRSQVTKCSHDLAWNVLKQKYSLKHLFSQCIPCLDQSAVELKQLKKLSGWLEKLHLQ